MASFRSRLYSCAALLALSGQALAGVAPAGSSGAAARPDDSMVQLAQAAPSADDIRRLTRARAQGAVESDIEVFLARRDARVRPYYRQLFVEGERNAVLNFNRLGLIELQRHNLEDAAWLFDRAAERIEQVYADDANAEKAKSIWNAESVKDFKGEPYERAMTFYYRGLVRMMMNDYENARANFRRAEQQTLMSEVEKYRDSSFGALTYLAGWASHCAGNEGMAQDFYKQAGAANPRLQAPDAKADTILINETGAGPRKIGEGKYREMLKMVAGSVGSGNAVFMLPKVEVAPPPPPAPVLLQTAFALDAPAEAPPPPPPPPRPSSVSGILASNISEQSMMRDGRQVDSILKGKANFKGAAETTGQVATYGGAMLAQQGLLSNNTDMAGIGAGIAIFGLLASAAAEAATPAADTRYWDTLPGGLEFATVKWEEGSGGLRVQRAGASAEAFTPKPAACRIAWVHEASVYGPESAPNSDPARRLDSRRLATDAAFRAQLLNDYSTPLTPPPAPPPAPAAIPVQAPAPAPDAAPKPL